jgi:FkbM family methyltransferase
MSCVIDLASRRETPTSLKRLSHPAGVDLPFGKQSDADLIIPEVRCAICTGAYSADIIGLLADAVRPGDRVLMVGAGLGVVSTLVARSRGVERVIAIDANTALTPYLKRVHALNGVPWVETVNAVLADGKLGRAPFFARHDPRTSSLLPDDGPWAQPLLVPCMDLNLILKEEEISLIICDIPGASAQLMALTELGSVERILVSGGDNLAHYRAANEVRSLLAVQGYTAEKRGSAALFERPGTEVWPVMA